MSLSVHGPSGLDREERFPAKLFDVSPIIVVDSESLLVVAVVAGLARVWRLGFKPVQDDVGGRLPVEGGRERSRLESPAIGVGPKEDDPGSVLVLCEMRRL